MGWLLSQVLTLYTTPVIYLYLDRLQHWLAPRRHRMPDAGGEDGIGGGRSAELALSPLAASRTFLPTP